MVARKKIGILGGMGPDGSILFMQEVLADYQTRFSPRYDHDYPEIVLYNLPIPDPASGIDSKDELIQSLNDGLGKLERFTVDFIVVPCNTVHVLIEEMRQAVSIPILSIVEETVKHLSEQNISSVGLLATEVTVESMLYQNCLQQHGIGTRLPADQAELDTVIRNIVSGKKLSQDKKYLVDEIERYAQQGLEAVVLGCTDLPVVVSQADVDHLGIELIDSLRIYAQATVSYCTAV